jgi:hypothetical protein
LNLKVRSVDYPNLNRDYKFRVWEVRFRFESPFSRTGSAKSGGLSLIKIFNFRHCNFKATVLYCRLSLKKNGSKSYNFGCLIIQIMFL